MGTKHRWGKLIALLLGECYHFRLLRAGWEEGMGGTIYVFPLLSEERGPEYQLTDKPAQPHLPGEDSWPML